MIKKFFINFISKSVLIIIFIFIYLYLTEPVSISYNIMGMEIGMKVWYQPFTSCVYSEMSLFGGKQNHSRCDVGVFEYLEMRNKIKNMDDNLYNLFSENN